MRAAWRRWAITAWCRIFIIATAGCATTIATSTGKRYPRRCSTQAGWRRCARRAIRSLTRWWRTTPAPSSIFSQVANPRTPAPWAASVTAWADDMCFAWRHGFRIAFAPRPVCMARIWLPIRRIHRTRAWQKCRVSCIAGSVKPMATPRLRYAKRSTKPPRDVAWCIDRSYIWAPITATHCRIATCITSRQRIATGN